jgi:cysteine desulfurase
MARMTALLQRGGHYALPHRFCQEQLTELERCTEAMRQFLGAHAEDTLVATSSGAEAINQLVRGVVAIGRATGKNEIITSDAEEAPITLICQRMAQGGDVKVRTVPLRNGAVDLQQFQEAISPRTLLASLSWANGLTGVLQPVDALSQLCEERGILLHLDASHVAGMMDLQLQQRRIDAVTLEGSLVHAPAGTGLLYLRRPMRLAPLIEGSQEQLGMRGGPMPLYLIGALAEACTEALEQREAASLEAGRLRHRLESQVQRVCFGGAERVPHITALAFPGVNSDALLYLLGQRGLYGSMGGGQLRQMAQLLRSCGIAPELSWCGISLGLSRLTQEREVDQAIGLIQETVRQLEKMGARL